MERGTSANITRNLNATQHYSYYFKDCNKYILSLFLNEENDFVVLMFVGELFHGSFEFDSLFPISDISCSLLFILWTLPSCVVINCAIWSTDHKVVINLSWVELTVQSRHENVLFVEYHVDELIYLEQSILKIQKVISVYGRHICAWKIWFTSTNQVIGWKDHVRFNR